MLVSVIIPVYNRRVFAQEAIASVLGQDYQNTELIIVEDGSDPQSRLWPPNLKHQLISYYYRPHRGVAAARNFGVTKAAGDYIAFLDSDDLWLKEKLQKQVDFLRRNPQFQVCYTNEAWFLRGERISQKKIHKKYHGWIFKRCLPLCIISASSIMMKKSVFQELRGFDESLPVCEDYDLWLRLSLRYPVAYLDEQLVLKRGGHADQLSKKYWGLDRFRIRAMEKLLLLGLDDKKRRRVIKELAYKYKILINGCRKHGRYFRWLYYKLRRRLTWARLGESAET